MSMEEVGYASVCELHVRVLEAIIKQRGRRHALIHRARHSSTGPAHSYLIKLGTNTRIEIYQMSLTRILSGQVLR